MGKPLLHIADIMMAQRLREAREAVGLTQQKVAELLRISRSAVSQWENGETQPDIDKIKELCQIYKTSTDWLLRGIDPAKVVQNFHESATDFAQVPLIDFVQAGQWTDIADPYALGQGSEILWTDQNVGKSAFGLTIEGQSMAPEFEPGDKIIVDPDVKPQPGDYVVAKLDNEERSTFKKYRPRGSDKDGSPIIELAPLNTDWPTLYIDAGHPGHIVGTMIEHRRFRRR